MPVTDPQTILVTQGAAGQTELVAAVAGTTVEVLAYDLSFDAAGSLVWESNSTDLTGVQPVLLGGNLQANAGYPLFRTAAGEALRITTVTAKAFGYVIVRKSTAT